jgi:flagellar hook-basal body complex protein FliE
MTVSIGNAVAAYARQAQGATGGALAPRSTDPAQSFSEMLGTAVTNAIETGRHSEQISARAIAGQADLREVVTAVTNAEVTLQTALSIRDKVIQAYQDVISMPI